jgi:uroporphyrinogen-III synthase
MEQNGWEALKTKPVFCVGIKTKELLGNGFTVDVYRLCLRISRDNHLNLQKFTFFGNLRKETLPQALKEAESSSTKSKCTKPLAPFKISDQENFDAIMFFSPSAVESYLSNNIKKNLFCIGSTTASALEAKKIKNM